MKSKLLYTFIACFSLWNAQANDTSEVLMLNQGWMFSQAGTDKWRSATVPGTVHQDLLNHQLLPDPFFGTNEKNIQWVENEDWEYKTTFTVTEEQLSREAAMMTFEGLDTYADVYLNGALLLKSDNMFVGYSVPVKEVLRQGENKLHVFFRSPPRTASFQSEGVGRGTLLCSYFSLFLQLGTPWFLEYRWQPQLGYLVWQENFWIVWYGNRTFPERVRFRVVPRNEDHRHFCFSRRLWDRIWSNDCPSEEFVGQWLDTYLYGTWFHRSRKIWGFCLCRSCIARARDALLLWSAPSQPPILHGNALLAAEW